MLVPTTMETNLTSVDMNFDLINDTVLSLPVAEFLKNGTVLNLNSLGDLTARSNKKISLSWISSVIRRELRWAFILHTYGFGCLFFVLAFYTFFSILNLRSLISARPFMSTINGFLCLLGATRAASLLIDPYHLTEEMPRILGQVIWDLGFPGIISAFCLVQLAFLQLTQLKLGPESLRKKTCLSLIITTHFTLIVAADIAVVIQEQLLIVKQAVQYIFLGWGVLLCCNFLYSGYKVMLLIRKLPGGFHRDLPDPNHKGIMQLAMLAPYNNNLASSVTAALLPTLCAPKIHQQENTSTSSLGFRNEANSPRILESESIPILEDLGGSSGDERSPISLARASSFQNPTRQSQKFNLRPKLSLRNEEDVKNKTPVKTPNTEDEFAQMTSFENENYKGFAGPSRQDTLVPNILISCPSSLSSVENIPQKDEGIEKHEMLSKLMTEIQDDLKEMNIDRGSMQLLNCHKKNPLSRQSSNESTASQNRRRHENEKLNAADTHSRRGSSASMTESNDSRSRRSRDCHRKSLSWRKKLRDEVDDPHVEDCLLPGDSQSNDVSLNAILNHIAFVNRNTINAENATQDVEKERKSQIEWVLNVTYITAMWGLMLCLTSMGQVQAKGPAEYEPLPRFLTQPSNSSSGGYDNPTLNASSVHTSGLFSSPWPWLWLQTFCRVLELAMGCAMANITRQSAARSRYPHTLRLRHRDTL